MLKFSYENESDIPADVKKYYKESTEGGKTLWVLQCEGAAPKAKLDEFRSNNIQLQKDAKALKDKLDAYGEITPDVAKELYDKQEDIRAHKAKKPEEIEAIVADRTKKITEAHTNEKTKLVGERDRYYNELCEHRINQAVVEEANKVGLRQTAVLDITQRARQIFTLKEGAVVALDKDGQTVVGEDGYTPLSINLWVGKLTKDAPHLFDSSAGAGGSGTRPGGPNAKIPNPWAKATLNLTQQGVITRNDPALAKRLKAEAESQKT